MVTALSTHWPPDEPVPPDVSGDVVRGLYHSLAVRDLSRVGAALTETAVWQEVSALLDTGTPRKAADELTGREAILAFLPDLVDASDGTFLLRIRQLFSSPAGRVVVLHEMSLPDGGLRDGCLLFEVADEQVYRVFGLSAAANGPAH